MRLGSLFFWVGFVIMMALAVLGYQRYMKDTRTHARSLNQATNQMGELKQGMQQLRKNYNTTFDNKRGAGTEGSGGVRANANKRMKALEKKMKGLPR